MKIVIMIILMIVTVIRMVVFRVICTGHWPSQWPGRPGFNPRSSHTKDSKIVLDASLLKI